MKGHPTYLGDTHCCACLTGAPHGEFDTTGCEFCDSTVVLVVITDGPLAIGLTHETNGGLEFRAPLEVAPMQATCPTHGTQPITNLGPTTVTLACRAWGNNEDGWQHPEEQHS